MRTWIPIILIATGPALMARAQTETQGTPPDVVRTSAGEVKVERLATLEYPWGMAYLPDGRLLITEKPGRLRIFASGRLSEPLAGLPRIEYRAAPGEQGGLLDVAVDPDFATNGFVYLSYTEAADPQPAGLAHEPEPRFGGFLDTSDRVLKGGAVARARLEGDQLRDVRVLWRQEPKTVGRGHYGNRIVFGRDGTLYITSGERMRFDPAQDLKSNLGKIVRINRDGSIPPDNPHRGRANARADIWSLGHRNVLAAAIHPTSGRLWIAEMGPLGGDELNLVAPGKNYGWPLVSNGDNYDQSVIPDHSSRPELEAPVRTWTPVISPSGMLFYDGVLFPAWRGHALIGGLSSQAIVRLVLDGTRVADEERIAMGRRIRDLIQSPDGAVLALVDDAKGDLLRLSPQGTAKGR